MAIVQADPSHPVRRRLRHPGLSYTGPGWFYATICSHDRRCIFGRCADGVFVPNWIGLIIIREWAASAALRKGIVLDEFQVMPNHFHCLFYLSDESQRYDRLLAGFKSAVTSKVREQKVDPKYEVWQRGSFDRVVRGDDSLEEIREYIRRNPERWCEDRLNPDAKRT